MMETIATGKFGDSWKLSSGYWFQPQSNYGIRDIIMNSDLHVPNRQRHSRLTKEQVELARSCCANYSVDL